LDEWLIKNTPLFIHRAGDRPLKVFKGVLAQFLYALWRDDNCDIDFTDLVLNQDKIQNAKEEDWIETIREKELHIPDKPWGLTEDFSTFVAVLEPGLVMQFDGENLAKASRTIIDCFGADGFVRAALRKTRLGKDCAQPPRKSP